MKRLRLTEMMMRAVLYSVFLAALMSTGCASCDDTTKKGPGETPCPAGQVRNPINGACEDEGSNNVNNVEPPNDAGSDPDDAGDVGTEPEPDMVSTTDMPNDVLSPDCEGNERRCNGNVVEMCVGGMFTTSQTCGQGLVCERGNCVPENAGACTPGETRCSGTNAVETCQPDGMTWGNMQLCPGMETCSGGVCTSGCAGLINEKSNEGCEYVSMRHNQASGLRVLPHTVVVSNPGDQPVDVTVTSPSGINHGIGLQTIQPLDSAVLNFPTSPMINQNGLSPNIYLIRSSRPVIATQFAPLNNPGLGSETSDASLLLPTNAVGMEYIVVGWRSLQPNATYVDIVALETGTTVTVESPLPLTGGSAGSVAANSSTMFTIPEDQVLHLSENRSFFDSGSRDVSGVRIVANKPVAVYTGATIVNIPDEPVRLNPPAGCGNTNTSCVANDDCCSGLCAYDGFGGYACADGLQAGDHVEQQLFPVESWGTSYIATPFESRTSNDFVIYRLVGGTDGTTVSLDPAVNGETMFTINRGEVRQFYSATAFELSASSPVMLAQFMIGGQISDSDDGDPAFLIPPAIEQYRDTYVFLVPGQYRKNNVTLVKKTGTNITLDGVMVAQMAFQPVGGASMWEYAIIDSVTAGVHRASSTEPFGVVVHGMDEYISYAFAGGITLPE